ncbi:MAG: hypothetical protein M0Z95_00570 [Actinomycetota bacterium]|nr:hypothetical protein [Actinomycetota bacterium]
MIGLAHKADWNVEVDVPTDRGTIPDLRVTKGTMRYTIEVTVRSADRRTRELDRQHFRIGDLVSTAEREFGVELSVAIHRILDVKALEDLSAEILDLARRCKETGRHQSFDVGIASGTAYSSGERPTDAPVLTGPALGGDMWPRFAERLHTKAQQTEGAGLTWIRIEEYTGLLMLTPAVHWTPEQQLAALQQNIVAELLPYNHVRGVVKSTGAAADWAPLAGRSGSGTLARAPTSRSAGSQVHDDAGPSRSQSRRGRGSYCPHTWHWIRPAGTGVRKPGSTGRSKGSGNPSLRSW